MSEGKKPFEGFSGGCMLIPNYFVDMQGNVIPPKNGEQPKDTFIFYEWEDGKMKETGKEEVPPITLKPRQP